MNGLIQQFSFFVVAGVLTTVVDFVIYNLLTRRPFQWTRIQANTASVTVAICFSFTINLIFVFKPQVVDVVSRAGKFLLVTTFSAYVLQNAVIYVTSNLWLGPVNAAAWLAHLLGLTRYVEDEFVKKNTVKLLAVTVGLAWNFVWYRWFVFKG